MNVAVWFGASLADRYLTGVGKHAVEMISGLSEQPGCRVELLLPGGMTAVHPSAASLGPVARKSLGLSRRWLSTIWALLGWPNIRHWAADCDWLYLPRELWVPPGRSRLAITVHDLWPLDRPGARLRDAWRWRWLLGRSLRRADLVLAVSRFTAERLQAHFAVPESRIRVVGNGAASAYYQSAGSIGTGRRGDHDYVVSVGGLTEKKGADRLLAMAREMARTMPDVKLVVVGPIEPKFRHGWPANMQHQERGGSDWELAALVAGARASLSLSSYEGFGITPVEAMAAGTPVIASDIPAHREVMGDAGLLVDATNTGMVLAALRAVMGDSIVAERLRAKGYARAEQYTWPRAVARLRAALEEHL